MDIQTPASHRNDPDTSFQAEEHINKSGKRKAQQKIVEDALKEHSGLTSAELASVTGLDRTMLARRLSEVGIKGVTVKCRINKTNAVTWYVKSHPKTVLPQAI